MNEEFVINVFGDYGCFTRPEYKVERFSYDVITPSASKSLFDAIYWKPQFKWKITKIVVLNKIKYSNIRRNEVKSKAPRNPKIDSYININFDRTQRSSRILKDLNYIICAKIDVKNKDYCEYKKHREIFIRRAEKGQRFSDLYFGCREFTCHYDYLGIVDKDITMNSIKEKVFEEYKNYKKDLDVSIFSMNFYDNEENTQKSPTPSYYKPVMIDGVINVPDFYNDSEVLKC